MSVFFAKDVSTDSKEKHRIFKIANNYRELENLTDKIFGPKQMSFFTWLDIL